MSEQDTRLALEISVQMTSLFRCHGDIPEECVGAVANDDPEFDHKLAAVISLIPRAQLAKLPAQIWLCDDQIILRHVRIDVRDEIDRLIAAKSALSAITPFKPEDLRFTLGEEDGEGYTPIAAVSNKKVDEVMALARKIGLTNAQVTSTDDIDGFDERPVWTLEDEDAPAQRKKLKVAALAAALVLPLIAAGTANNVELDENFQALMAFTPTFSQSADPVDLDNAALIAPRAPVAPGVEINTASAPKDVRLTPEEMLAARNERLTAFVQQDVADLTAVQSGSIENLVRPFELRAVSYEASVEALAPTGAPDFAPDDEIATDPVNPLDLDDEIVSINFLTSINYSAGAGLWEDTASLVVANLDVDSLPYRPRTRPAAPIAAPRLSALPKLRPSGPLPDEQFDEADLPRLVAPVTQSEAPDLPGSLEEARVMRVPRPIGSLVETDVAAAMEMAEFKRRQYAKLAAAWTRDRADANTALPPPRDALPGPGGGGAMVQVKVVTGPARFRVQTEGIPAVPTRLAGVRFDPELFKLVAGIPDDARGIIDTRTETRAQEARLASLIPAEEVLTTLPPRRSKTVISAVTEAFDDEAGEATASLDALRETTPGVLETQPEAAEDVLAAVAVETEQADQDLVEEIAAALGAGLQDGEASDGAQVAALDARAADVEEPAELAPPVVQDAPQIEVALALQPKLRPARQIAATSARAQIGGVSSSDDVMASLLPLSRPSGLATRAAEIIKERESVTAKVEAKQQPKAATPSAALNIPSNARVARVATLTDAIDLGDLALVGIFGKSSSRYAMLRTSQGKITKVQTGQKVSGWTVSAIAEDGVRIQKRSKTRVLRLPN
jgi:hypothetical protein